MAEHPEVELLSAWLDGETTADEARELRLHLSGCLHCRMQVEELADVGSALAPLRAVAAPSSLHNRLLAMWEERWGQLRLKRTVGSFALGWMPSLAAGTALAILAPSFIHAPDNAPADITTTPRQVSRVSIPVSAATPPEKAITAAVSLLSAPAQSQAAKGVTTRTPFSNKTVRKPSSGGEPYRKTGRSYVAAVTPPTVKTRRPALTKSSEETTEKEAVQVAITTQTLSAEDLSAMPKILSPRPLAETSPQTVTSHEPETTPEPERVFTLIVEEDETAAPPPQPRTTVAAWAAENPETGLVNRASITRHYDENGGLERVVMNIPLPAPEEGEADTPDGKPEPSSIINESPADLSPKPFSEDDKTDETSEQSSHRPGDLYVGIYDALRMGGTRA